MMLFSVVANKVQLCKHPTHMCLLGVQLARTSLAKRLARARAELVRDIRAPHGRLFMNQDSYTG